MAGRIAASLRLSNPSFRIRPWARLPRIDGAPAPDHAPTPLEKRLSDVNAANAKFLAPYREKIQNLIGVVRNPANLPK